MPATNTVRPVAGMLAVTFVIVGVQYGCAHILLRDHPAGENWFTSDRNVALVWLGLVSLVVIPLVHRAFKVPNWVIWGWVTLLLQLFVAYLAYMRFPTSWGDARVALEVVPVFGCLILGQREAHRNTQTMSKPTSSEGLPEQHEPSTGD